MDKSAFTNSERERLLAYAMGLVGSRLSNPNMKNGRVHNWLLEDCIKDAKKIIDIIFDDEKLNAVLNSKDH